MRPLEESALWPDNVPILLHNSKNTSAIERHHWTTTFAVVPTDIELVELLLCQDVLSGDNAFICMRLQEKLASAQIVALWINICTANHGSREALRGDTGAVGQSCKGNPQTLDVTGGLSLAGISNIARSEVASSR